jgi:myo-inositol-1-phosphate synthase
LAGYRAKMEMARSLYFLIKRGIDKKLCDEMNFKIIGTLAFLSVKRPKNKKNKRIAKTSY